MNRAVIYLAAAVAALAAAAWAQNAAANAGANAIDNTTPEDPSADSSPSWTDELSGATATVNPFAMYEKSSASSDAQDPQVAAWLATIKYTEGADQQADPYAVVYGYAFTITDFSNHPANLGWKGGPITRGQYAGKVSTAAGAFQINGPTWNTRIQPALALPDFSAASQDAAAVWLTDKAGALDAVKAGDMATACRLCHALWASLPGSTAGQGGKSFEAVQTAFTDAGGTLA
jgi:muramidase (phage lysozyme)